MKLLSWFTRPAKRDQPLYLRNTRTGEKELFSPFEGKPVRMYNCGPTVYDRQHIGNLSMFVFTDVLRRTLEFNGMNVDQVINFTDVGHLSSDADEGDDKMTKGLQREGLELTLENMLQLGERYASIFLEDIRALNVRTDGVRFPRASEHIPAQIAMIQTLEEKGYAYPTKDGVYFDTSKFPEYGSLGSIDLSGLREGARVAPSKEKRNPTDFNLWKFDRRIGWDSPWGKGFPGWHIECSAMIRALLGQQIDIHTGGIEHIAVHHNNEIAQSEAATGKKPLSRFWLHRAHLQLEGAKIAKSTGNTVYLSDIVERGYDPLALRYLFLQSHYRTPANFTWEALGAAQQALHRLRGIYAREDECARAGNSAAAHERAFRERINDDLDTPGALAVLWETVRDDSLSASELRRVMKDFDRVLGIDVDGGIRPLSPSDLPEHIAKLVENREQARASKNWQEADALREQIEASGYELDDTKDGPRLTARVRN